MNLNLMKSIRVLFFWLKKFSGKNYNQNNNKNII